MKSYIKVGDVVSFDYDVNTIGWIAIVIKRGFRYRIIIKFMYSEPSSCEENTEAKVHNIWVLYSSKTLNSFNIYIHLNKTC